MAQYKPTAHYDNYDVVIIGGAIMGSSVAWFLSENADFNGRVLVVERDPSYEFCSTAHTNSCIRQQFSTRLNIAISQFGADFIKNLHLYMADDERVPQLDIHNFGYLYLVDSTESADILRASQKIQLDAGTETRLLNRAEIGAQYPFYQLDDIELASINTKNEGYFDGGTLFECWRRSARTRGVEYIANEVVEIRRNSQGRKVQSIVLATGEKISCNHLINASGPRAAHVAGLAGITIPVEPRKRYTWVFTAEKPLDRDLPLTIDPSGVHFRQDGPASYMAGSKGEFDPAVIYDDFTMDHSLWENHVWPIIANRIPQFEALRVINEWAGHYAFNTLDQNAVLGPHNEVENFIFINGFSGHGLQQSPAMGRGIAEWLSYGEYRSLDLSPFSYERIVNNQPIIEKAII